MHRFALAALTAGLLTGATTASAISIPNDLPNLNFPSKSAPESTQGCAKPADIKAETCEQATE